MPFVLKGGVDDDEKSTAGNYQLINVIMVMAPAQQPKSKKSERRTTPEKNSPRRRPIFESAIGVPIIPWNGPALDIIDQPNVMRISVHY